MGVVRHLIEEDANLDLPQIVRVLLGRDVRHRASLMCPFLYGVQASRARRGMGRSAAAAGRAGDLSRTTLTVGEQEVSRLNVAVTNPANIKMLNAVTCVRHDADCFCDGHWVAGIPVRDASIRTVFHSDS